MARATPPADAPVRAAVDGMTAFAAELYRVAAKPGENAVLSPVSITIAFAMLSAGAGGTTAAQIGQVLRLPAGGGTRPSTRSAGMW